MKRQAILLTLAAVCGLASAAHALYSLAETGMWPKSWPEALEPLRTQSRTLVGPMAPQRHYAIRFNSRKELEAAWPHILKVKTKGAPVFLVRAPNFFLGEGVKAGVVIHVPPEGQEEGPMVDLKEPRARWFNTTIVDLVVDGEIVDPKQIRFPRNVPVVDERAKAKTR